MRSKVYAYGSRPALRSSAAFSMRSFLMTSSDDVLSGAAAFLPLPLPGCCFCSFFTAGSAEAEKLRKRGYEIILLDGLALGNCIN